MLLICVPLWAFVLVICECVIVKKRFLIDLARMIKFYSLGCSSYYVGGCDALCLFLESQGYEYKMLGLDLVIFDRSANLVLRV